MSKGFQLKNLKEGDEVYIRAVFNYISDDFKHAQFELADVVDSEFASSHGEFTIFQGDLDSGLHSIKPLTKAQMNVKIKAEIRELEKALKRAKGKLR